MDTEAGEIDNGPPPRSWEGKLPSELTDEDVRNGILYMQWWEKQQRLAAGSATRAVGTNRPLPGPGGAGRAAEGSAKARA